MKTKSARWQRIIGWRYAKVTILLASLLITLLFVELTIFHVFDIKPPGYRPDRFFIFSHLTGVIHKPNAEGYWYGSNGKQYVSTNSYGFSDLPREVSKNRTRIALIGDSTTEFWEVDEEQRPQHTIENMLEGKVEALNFGVRAYGTDQSYLLFKHIGVHFSPDIVVYLFCINDPIDNVSRSGKPYFIVNSDGVLVLNGYPVSMPRTGPDEYLAYTDFPTLRRMDKSLKKASYIYRELRTHPGIRGLTGYHMPLDVNFELRPYKKLYNEEDLDRMRITLKLILEFHRFVSSHGAKFLLVEGLYEPAGTPLIQAELVKTYGDVFDFEKVTTILEQFSTTHGIEFVSLMRISKNQGIVASELVPDRDGIHMNNQGALLYAKTIVTKLRSLNWLEDSDNVTRQSPERDILQ